MLAATKRWFNRNRRPIAIAAGVVGTGYVVTSYLLSKLRDARERMSSDRIAKENLRRRFEQNQEDCTYTVLALLPNATAQILDAMNTEKITLEIQQFKGSALAKARSVGSTSPPSMSEANATDDDGRSIITVTSQGDTGIQTTQLSVPTPLTSTAGSVVEKPQDAAGATAVAAPSKPRKTKKQLWDEVTITSITRSFTLVYTLSLLTLLTRIQLNLLGRRSYLSSVVSLATGGGAAHGGINLENNDDDGGADQAYGTDLEVNRKYLTFSWWLLNRGWAGIAQRVEPAVRRVYGHLSPRDSISLDTFARLAGEVRALIERPGSTTVGLGAHRGPGALWLPFLLPEQSMEDFVLREAGVLDASETLSPDATAPPSPAAASLRRLLDETADLIESPHFAHVNTQLLDAGFSLLLDHKLIAGVEDALLASSTSAPPPSILDTSSFASASLDRSRPVPLPKILSVLTRQAHAIGQGMPGGVPVAGAPGVPANEYLQAMEAVHDLEAFAAVVYSSNWEAEIVAADGDGPGSATSQAQAQARTASGAGLPGDSDSVIVVAQQDPSSLFESAWERASATASASGAR
ncbi:hypothetical protein VTJ83DRAFT_2562 [Remersonia thermophila]|uniref:Peroxin-3 n=1 Tax=Remersonia thermophila TaxID=72144 RepID=A0ABR4DJ48_9PEZI